MGENVEGLEVNILADDDIFKEKMACHTNGIDRDTVNGTRTISITDDLPTKSDQLSDNNQPINDDEHRNWNIMSFYKQIKSLCFRESKKKAERQQRIRKILISINGIEANLNNLPDDGRFRCSKTIFEIFLLVLAIIIVVAVFMVPVVLYYTGPPFPELDQSMIEYFKTCQFPPPVC